jgi:hypothetical protein
MYGGIKPSTVLGHDEFARHDASQTWDDAGIHAELAADLLRSSEDAITEAVTALRDKHNALEQELSATLHSYAAHQVRDAVVDYLGQSEFYLVLHEGEIHIMIDGSNDLAAFQPLVKLDQLLMRAKTQATQQGDMDFLSRMADLTSALPNIQQKLAETPTPMPIHAKRASRVPGPPPRAPGRIPAKGGGARAAAAR